MTANREIKIYGTLLNATVNAIIGDADHNDALAYAYQLYDDRFGESTLVNNFQDIINKRVTAISYADGITTIKNRAGVQDGVPYMFVVEGASKLNGATTINNNLFVDGTGTFTGNVTAPNVENHEVRITRLEDIPPYAPAFKIIESEELIYINH